MRYFEPGAEFDAACQCRPIGAGSRPGAVALDCRGRRYRLRHQPVARYADQLNSARVRAARAGRYRRPDRGAPRVRL